MKKIISCALALGLVLVALLCLSFGASAEEPALRLDIAGVTEPVIGQTLTTQGITGGLDGFTMEASWAKYDYNSHYFVDADGQEVTKGVYRLAVRLVAEQGNVLPYDQMGGKEIVGTVNGAAADYAEPSDGNEVGFTAFTVMKVYILGDVTLVDKVEITQLPAVAAGTATANPQIGIPAGANYQVLESYWHAWEGGEVGEALEDGKRYTLSVNILPKEGYWFAGEIKVDMPLEGNVWQSKVDPSISLEIVYDLRKVVERVDLKGDFAYTYGQSTAQPGITLPDNANYEIDSVKFQHYVDGEGLVDFTGETLQYGEYYMLVTIVPKGEYVFENAQPYINDQYLHEVNGWGYHDSGDRSMVLSYNLYIEPENGFADAYISGAPGKLTAGADIATPALTVKRGGVEITKVQWLDDQKAAVTGKFASGKVYYLEITMAPKEGYGLRSGYYSEVQQEDEGYIHPYQQVNADGTATMYLRYSLLPVVEKVELTMPVPAVGGNVQKPTVPQDAKYELVNIYVYDEITGEPATAYEAGKSYYLEIELKPAEGYDFSEELVFTLNGVEEDAWGGADSAGLSKRISFKAQIDRVDITMPEPTVGGTGSISSITLPNDAKYGINQERSQWYAYSGAFNGTFAAGNKYGLELMLMPKEGYEFAEDVKIYLNGKEYENYGGGYDHLYISYEKSFRTQITKVEFPAMPTVKAGDEGKADTLQAPQGAHYTMNATWSTLSAEDGMQEFAGTLESGKVYYLVYAAEPEQGYEFAEDLVITVGGQSFKGMLEDVGDEYVYIVKMYPLGVQTIDKVELTTDKPVAGKAPGKVTVSDKANYELEGELSWYVGKTDSLKDLDSMKKKDVFEKGKYYFFMTALKAKEGYVFAENVQFFVNGQEVDMDEVKELLGMYVMGDVAYAVCSVGRPADPSNPPTGDQFPVVTMAVVALVSAAALCVTVAGKKRFF